jgi:predicted RNase H-like HicB family nuclease
MTTEYIQAALRKVVHEQEDNTVYAEIPDMPDVLASGDS